ncbi:hypothetical protein [Brevibacillus borstelensis]|uniref:hypothetical protein n=1 Tax=Brevibacillus borstelensis TaxID=45462 RepID=UPI0030C0FCD9
MKKFMASILCTVLLAVPCTSFAKESQHRNVAVISDLEGIETAETFVDETWKNSPDIRPDNDRTIKPSKEDCGCDDVIKKKTKMIWIGDEIPVEYTVHKGKLVVMKRPDLYYYTQNFTQTWWNQYSGQFAQRAAEGYGTYVSFQIGGKIPYMARLLKLKDRGEKPFQYADYAMAVLGYMTQEQIPLWGDIISTPVPNRGTEISLIYISKTGKDNSWKYRVRFEVEEDGTVSYKQWVVK